MEKKELKYKQYLEKYKNCPNEEFKAKDVPAFRWVHEEVTSDDFLPNILHPLYPIRSLDSSDTHCETFALSVYKDLQSAVKMYHDRYSKTKRDFNKEKFKNQKGIYVAHLNLKAEDGLTDEPDVKTGHFSFFEYVEFNYLGKIIQLFDIFAYNDTDKDIQN